MPLPLLKTTPLITNHTMKLCSTTTEMMGPDDALEFPTQLTANNTNTERAGHENFQALSSNQQALVKWMKAKQDNYTDGKRHVLRLTSHIEMFHLNKLWVSGVQIGIHMNFISPNLFLNGVNVAGRLTYENVRVRMYL